MPTPATNSPARESGLGLVEIVVVVLIIAILMAAMVSQMRSSKQATYLKAGSSVASAYMDVVEAYMADNGQTPPKIGGPDWPADEANMQRGPVNRLLVDANDQPRRYLKTVPEQVTNGLIAFGPQGVAPKQARVTVEYVVSGQSYAFVVRSVDDAERGCFMSNAATQLAATQGLGKC